MADRRREGAPEGLAAGGRVVRAERTPSRVRERKRPTDADHTAAGT